MTDRHPLTVEAAHAAALTAVQELHDAAMADIEALARSFGTPAVAVEDDREPRQHETSAGPATLELPRPATPVQVPAAA